MRSWGTISFNRTATTESVSRKLKELPRVWASSKSSCASWRAETIEARKEVARTSAALGTSANPADGATDRFWLATEGKGLFVLSDRRTTCSSSRYLFSIAATTCGSKLVSISEIRCFMASSTDIARRYGRSDVSESKQSTTERMRAPIGITFPLKPYGYPLPSHFSWWDRTMGTTG